MIVQIMGGPKDGKRVEAEDQDNQVIVDWFDSQGGGPIPMVTTLDVHRPFHPLHDEAYAVWPGYQLL